MTLTAKHQLRIDSLYWTAGVPLQSVPALRHLICCFNRDRLRSRYWLWGQSVAALH